MYATDWLAKRAALSPQKVAIIEEETGQTLTYGAWDQQCNQLANFFQKGLSIEPGDRVAILSMNRTEYLDAWFACAKRGAVLQNLNWRLTASELLQLVQDAEPKAVIYSTEFLDTIAVLQEGLPSCKHWLALDEKARDEDLPFAQRDEYPVELDTSLDLPLDTPWLLCYTGGSTGLPKGAVLTHRSMLFNALNTISSWELDAKDTAILNAPLFHVGGLAVFTAPLVYAGGTSILCKSFDVERTFSLLDEYDVSIFFGVPTMFIMMQEDEKWDQADFSRLKFVISGGAPCPLPVFEKFWAKEVMFKTGYGLTEAGPNNFWLPPEDVQRKPNSVGFPLMHVDTKIIDGEGNELGNEEVGELIIRGPHVMKEYWRKPEATKESLRNGWLHTGDFAKRDSEGYYFIVGRLKEMFISGGENVYPAEIETILHEHSAIAEATVFGIPDPKWGEIGLAVVRLLEGESLDTGGVKAYCQEHLARYKVPRRFEFVSEIPKTGAGKIDKVTLRKQYSA